MGRISKARPGLTGIVVAVSIVFLYFFIINNYIKEDPTRAYSGIGQENSWLFRETSKKWVAVIERFQIQKNFDLDQVSFDELSKQIYHFTVRLYEAIVGIYLISAKRQHRMFLPLIFYSLCPFRFFFEKGFTYQEYHEPPYFIGYSIGITSNTNYVVSGYYNNGAKICYSRMTSSLTQISTLYYGTAIYGVEVKLCVTSTDGVAILGTTTSGPNGNYDAYVVRLDNADALLWEKYYGGSGEDFGCSISCFPNGNIVVVGKGYFNNLHQGWALVIDSSGNQLFEFMNSSPVYSIFRAVNILSDGGFIVGGQYRGSGSSWECCFARLDSSGGKIWENINNNPPSTDSIYDLAIGSSSNFFGCGFLGGIFYVIMSDTDGNKMWSQIYDGSGSESCRAATIITEDIYASAGYTDSFEIGNYDALINVYTYGGTMFFQKNYGGAFREHFYGLIVNNDGYLTAVGDSYSYSSPINSYQNLYIVIEGSVPCPAGYMTPSSVCTPCLAGTYSQTAGETACTQCSAGNYQPVKGSTSCIKCSAGTYQPNEGSVSCVNCSAGSYQSNEGQASCISCSAGTYQPNEGQQSCLLCPTGTYQDLTGKSECIQCAEGYYQDQTGQTSCKFCDQSLHLYPNVKQNQCLYKGIFATEAEFVASAFKTNCFDSGGNIITPYTETCRSSFRSLCCSGSSILSSSGPICNNGLGISSTSSLYNKYCSACTFMDQTLCPAQGVCWNDLFFVDNAYNPYSSFGLSCIIAIKSYCKDKLQINANDGECYIFKKECASATVISAGYGSSSSKFFITTEQKITTGALSNAIFLSGFSDAIVTRKSMTELSVDISNMASPPTSFQFKYQGLQTLCGLYFSDSIVHSITLPTVTLETVSITSSSSPINVCKILTFSSSVAKPYSWNIEYKWNVQYTTVSTPSALEQIISGANKATLSLDTEFLLLGETLQASLTITNPFSQTITSEVLSLSIISPTNKQFPCSACQFNDRTKCLNFDGICWEDYTEYNSSYPLLFTEDCLIGIAPECFSIWANNGMGDTQCLEFISYFDFAKMSIKPTVTSSKYLIDGILKIRIVFDTEIKTVILSSCNSIFNENTLKLLGSNPQCVWASSKILDVVYSATNSLVKSLTLREKSIYYNYKYAANPADSTTLNLTMPDLSEAFSINAPSKVPFCKTLILAAVSKVTGIFKYNYKWELSYPSESPSSTILTNFQALATQDSSILAVSSENLIPEKNLQILLTVHVSFLEVDISVLKTIYITTALPVMNFASSELYELTLIGSETNDLGLVIDINPCKTGNPPETETTFSVYSGVGLTNINTRTSTETKIEQTLLLNFQLYKILQVNVNVGFQYNHFYNVTVCTRYIGYQLKSCITKIIGIYKPAIAAIISGAPTIVSTFVPLTLYGARSLIPLEVGEKVKFSWQCISCFSLQTNSTCDCPYLSESQSSSRLFTIPKKKLNGSCKYKFRLTVTSQDGAFLRTGSVDTMFVTYSGTISSPKGIIIYGNQNDIYFTFTVSYTGKDSDLSFKWSLIEASGTLSENTFSYSILNTFLYDFFLQKLITLNSSCKGGDQEIPDSKKPIILTSDDRRVLGIDRSSLISEAQYTYGVLIQEPDTTSLAILSIKAPKRPATRSLSITPITGNALETVFLFTFPVVSGTRDSNEIVKLIVVNCDGSEKLVYYSVGSSTTFENVLYSGDSDCNYKVTVILRAIIGEEFIDSNFTIFVHPSSEPTTTAISSLLSLAHNSTSYKTKLSMLSSISLTSVTSESEAGKSNINDFYKLMCEMDNEKNGVITQLDDTEKLQFLNFSLNILENLLEQNIVENINLTLQDSIEQKILTYISNFETSSNSVYLIPSTIRALSASANLKKKREGQQSYEILQKTLDKLNKIILVTLQPNGLIYEISSPMIALKIFRQYANDFDLSRTITNTFTKKFKNISRLISSSDSQTTTTAVDLPSGLKQKVIDCLPFVAYYNTTFMISTSMLSLKINPYENIKTNLQIDVDSISKNSFNTAWIDVSIVHSIYRDLRRHTFDDLVNLNYQETDLIQINFNGSSLEKDATITEYENQVNIGVLDNNKTVGYHHPFVSSQETRENSIIIPCYKKLNYWTNENCTLTSVSDSEISSISTTLGYREGSTSGHTLDIISDVLSDTWNILQSGHYDMLVSFDAFNDLSVKNIVILCVLGIIFIGMLCLSYVLYLKDKKAILKQKIKTLKYLVLRKELPPPNGFVVKLFRFLNSIKRKGLKAISEENTIKVYPGTIENTTRTLENIDSSNGYTSFNTEEQKQLEDLHKLWCEKLLVMTKEELLEIFDEEIKICPPLSRRTADHIEDIMMGFSGITLVILQQPLLSALIIVGLRVTRPVKVLIFGLVVFGEFAVSGLFYNSEESVDLADDTVIFFTTKILYSVVAAAVLFPIKFIINYMFSGCSLNETMTREKIEAKEKCAAILAKVGIFLGWGLFAVEIFAIVMFSVNFNDNALNSWLLTYASAFVTDNIIFYLCNFGIILVSSVVLMKIIDAKLIQKTTGKIIGCIFEFILNTIS